MKIEDLRFKIKKNKKGPLKEEEYEGFMLGPSGSSVSVVRTTPSANGVYMAAPIIYNPNYLFAREIAKKFQTKYNKPLTHQAAVGYDFINILAGLLEDEEISRTNMKRLLEEGFVYPGIFGTINVKAGEHDISIPLHPARIVDGEIEYWW